MTKLKELREAFLETGTIADCVTESMESRDERFFTLAHQAAPAMMDAVLLAKRVAAQDPITFSDDAPLEYKQLASLVNGYQEAARLIMKEFAASDQKWTPEYARWRHGGWYVSNITYPSGACGCVSNSYPDKKWRVVCDDRRNALGEPGDFTFPSRDAAARAEFALANATNSN